jgi:hypothetical protein
MPTEVLRTDTFETWRQKSNTISADIGTTSALDSNLINKTITLTETGNYVAGQVVTGSLSGVTATVVSINGTILTVKNVSAGTFIDRSVQKSYMSVVNGSGSYTPGATITGSISGATAKVFSFNSVDSTLVIYNITGAFQSSPPENIVQGGTTRQLIGVILNNSSDSGENIVQASPSVSKQLKSFNHDVVSSLNEHQSDIGDVDSLGTSSKNLVGAVNEVKNSTITFNGNKTFSGNTSLQGVLGVQGATSLQGVLGVQGATSLSTVSTSGLATLHSALVSNGLTVQGTTSLQTVNYSSGTVSGNLSVQGTAGIQGALSTNSNFTAGPINKAFTYDASSGDVVIKGNLKIEGVTDITSTNYVPAWSGITGKPSPVITVAITGDVVGTASVTLTELAAGTYTASITTAAKTNLGLTTPLIGGGGANFSGSTSGQLNLKATAAAGSGVVITLPATTGTVITTGDSGTVTNAMLAGSIANNKLINSSVTVSAGTGLGGGGPVSLGGSVTLTNAGVTSAAAGNTGILVNTSTGAITISHGSTSNLSGAQGGNGISSITVDAFGHVTAVGTSALPYATQTYVNDYVTSRGYITGITSANVTTALSYTPYNGATNLNGYITSAALAGYATQTYVNDYVTTRGYITSAGSCAFATSSGSTTGNAATSTQLATGRTIAITGDLTYTSQSFNGTANVTAVGTLATVASAGTTGSSTAIPVITINAKGLTTSITTVAVVAPAGTLTGNTLASGVTASSLTSVGTLNGLVVTGTITATGDITAGTSDDRLKTRFGNIPDALNKVLQLNGFYYTHNKTAQQLGLVNKGQRVGVSAQEVLKVLPEVIRDAPVDESYMTVDYAKMVPLLIEAIKGLNAKVESLEAQLKK